MQSGTEKKRKYDRYTLAYKLQAVRLANHPGVKATEIAESLGIHVVLLLRWQMELVESAGMIRSMSRKGTPQDNATVESFFHSLKSKVVKKRIYQNEIEAVAEIIEHIHFYNSERLHWSLGYQSPETFEWLCA